MSPRKLSQSTGAVTKTVTAEVATKRAITPIPLPGNDVAKSNEVALNDNAYMDWKGLFGKRTSENLQLQYHKPVKDPPNPPRSCRGWDCCLEHLSGRSISGQASSLLSCQGHCSSSLEEVWKF